MNILRKFLQAVALVSTLIIGVEIGRASCRERV